MYFTSAVINILACTFSGNTGSTGGAIYSGQNATLNVNKSTIANNAASLGGGIYCYTPYSANSFSITNSTVVNNTAIFGGGIGLRTSTTFSLNATFKSSVIAHNGPENIRAFNDTITSLGYNVFGDSVVVGSIATDQLAISDSMLSFRPLGNYGGFTQTAPPNKGSVAINAGDPLDMSSAQNMAIAGVRDAGAAELMGIYHDTITACTQTTWYGTVYSVSGDYVKLLPNADTVATLNLIIIPFTTGVDVISTCTSYTWTDGVTYCTSNYTATDTLVNSIGCDSIVTLNLTFIPPATGIDIVTACESFTWIDGVTYTASNNTASDTLTTPLGCDSIVTLNLTIHQPSSGVDVIYSCDPITWIDGVTYTASNNTATDTLINALGCDSVVTLDLTILQVNVSTIVNEPTITAHAAQASYRWLDCNNNYAIIPGQTSQAFTATANGSYAVEVTELGCVDTSACVNITTIGSEEFENPKTVRVFPNPTSQFLHVEQLLPGIEKRISLVNLLGQEIMALHTIATAIELDVQGIAPNVYILHVVSEQGIFTQKIYVSTQ
jgi:predicted outer membrane repeat protein